MALDKFQPYLFVSAGEQSNKFLTPVISTDGIASFQAQRAQDLTGLTVRIEGGQEGTGDPSPTNIRPISGRTGLTVTRAGKNLLPISTISHQEINYSDGFYNVSLITTSQTERRLFGNWGIANAVSLGLAGGTYIWHQERVSINGGVICSTIIRVSPHGTAEYEIWAENTARVINDDDKFFILLYFGTANATYNCKIGIQIEPGSTATAYEPYTAPTEYPITWETEAGTIYGGTLNVTTGVLTVTDVCITLTSSSTHWQKSTAYPGNFFIPSASVAYDYHVPEIKNYVPFVCSHAKSVTQVQDLAYGCCFMDSSVNIRILQGSNTLADWLNYLDAQVTAGTPVQVCCQLATPQTYKLTPTEVRTIAGYNQIYSDAGPIIDIKF